MDALEALTSARGWNQAWTRLITARQPRTEADNAALSVEFRKAANIILCWDEAADVIATTLALGDAETQRIRVSDASGKAWQDFHGVAGDGLLVSDKGQPFDLAASRAHAATAVQSAATKALAAEDRLRDSLAKRRTALENRLYDVGELRRRGIPAIEEEIARRAARIGDLATLRPLLISMTERPATSVTAAVDELATARARAERAEQLRARALTVGETIAAENELSAATAEVRAIERRETGDGEDALAAGLAHVEAMAARDRLPG